MNRFSYLAAIFTLLIAMIAPAQAKEALVLLPIQGADLTLQQKDVLRAALQEGLSNRYKVFSGSEVDKKLKKFSQISCDETECLQEVAIAFQGELVGRGLVLASGAGYLITVEIKNIFADEVVYSKTESCRSCDVMNVMNQLKAMAAGRAPGSSSVRFTALPFTSGPKSSGIKVIGGNTATTNSASELAALILDSQPSGATVYLGNLKAGIAPYQNLSLSAGQTLQITLKKPNYHDKRLQLQLNVGINLHNQIKLDPAVGGLVIESEPSDATLFLAGEKIGTTPYRKEQLASGNYLLTLKYPLYHTLTNQHITIKDGETTQKRYTLTTNYGTLAVTASPQGSTIEISDANDQPVATKQSPARFKLTPASYTIKLSQPGYEPKQYRITMAKDETLTLADQQATLRRLEGTVIISSEPFEAGAKIYIDGASEPAGQVPATLTLPVGERLIRIAGEAGKGEKKLKVVDRDSHSLVVALKSAPRVTRGWLGVVIQDVTRELAESFGMDKPGGALVSQVLPDSPAQKADFEVGDVIVSFGGREVDNSSALPPMVGVTPVDQKVPVKVLRRGKHKQLHVVIGELPRGWLGVLIQDVTRELAESFGMDKPSGALVSQVLPDSPAQKAGFEVGDVIVSFGGREVDNSSTLPPMVGVTPVDQKVPVKVLRRGKHKQLHVVIGERPSY